MREQIRKVDIDGYTLTLWATNRTDWRGQTKLAYLLESPTGEEIFSGDDFSGSPLHGDDSDETLAGLLGFLTLQPGDTDPEYFENYTERQLDFARNEAESLQIWSMEASDGRPDFIDL